MERITKAQVERRIAIMQREGFDVGYAKNSVGLCITTKEGNETLSSYGTAGHCHEFLCAMEKGARQYKRGKIKFAY